MSLTKRALLKRTNQRRSSKVWNCCPTCEVFYIDGPRFFFGLIYTLNLNHPQERIWAFTGSVDELGNKLRVLLQELPSLDNVPSRTWKIPKMNKFKEKDICLCQNGPFGGENSSLVMKLHDVVTKVITMWTAAASFLFQTIIFWPDCSVVVMWLTCEMIQQFLGSGKHHCGLSSNWC